MTEAGILGLFTGFLGSVLGWQVNLVSLQRGMERGRNACFLVGLGAVAADLLIIIITLTSAAALLDKAYFWIALKTVGVGTLAILGVTTLFRKHEFATKTKRPEPAKSFLVGFFLVIANPAVFLMWIGVVGFLLTHFSHLLQFRRVFTAGFFAGAVVWFLMLAYWMMPHTKTWREEHLYWISKAAAVALLIAAAWLFFEKF